MAELTNMFDWVTERSKCSMGVMFDRLYIALKQDVESANRLIKNTGNSVVTFHQSYDRGVITVTRELANAISTRARVNVYFSLSSAHIMCQSDIGEKFTIIPSLKPDGACKMLVNGEELEVWQVCRKALEKLIFELPD